ncbi:MAG: NADP-dependent isocitrate dehydrogenase, partial [Acidobacteria bacterium]|nr:NADP-dependent isocitrate dehydrogenase [Acidobacteriota bacterium]
VILSGVMMLDHMGWKEAAASIVAAVGTTIGQKQVTYDLERQMPGATRLKTSEFADAIIKNL